ncbi:MAG TPA: competence protein CoiA family protein [Sporolactobacillaceae bacterium]|nr:competence protein CoiA family protein [Sporolactobacillaceae bacterium]
MLVARNEKGEWVSLVNNTNRVQLLGDREKHSYFCPACGEKLILKLGEKTCFHFAHYKDSPCQLQGEPETLTHIHGKKAIYNWLKTQGETPILEMYLNDIRQRADVGLQRFPFTLAFEFQCSSIPPSLLKERDQGYRSQSIRPLWIWNHSRLKTIGNHLYALSPLEWHTRRFPFTHPPHNHMQRQKGFLTFFDPTVQTLTFVYHLIPLNARNLWAESLTLPLTELTLQSFLTPHLPLHPKPNWHPAWLNLKKRWRTSGIPRLNHFEWDLQRLSETKGVIWKAFPGVVGNPVGDDHVIEQPVYLWQGWLCLTFYLHKMKGDRISLPEIKNAFLTLINKRWIVLSASSQVEEAWNLLVAYMNALVTIRLLERADLNTFVVKKPLQWGSPFFEELIMEDKNVLLQWNQV